MEPIEMPVTDRDLNTAINRCSNERLAVFYGMPEIEDVVDDPEDDHGA